MLESFIKTNMTKQEEIRGLLSEAEKKMYEADVLLRKAGLNETAQKLDGLRVDVMAKIAK